MIKKMGKRFGDFDRFYAEVAPAISREVRDRFSEMNIPHYDDRLGECIQEVCINIAKAFARRSQVSTSQLSDIVGSSILMVFRRHRSWHSKHVSLDAVINEKGNTFHELFAAEPNTIPLNEMYCSEPIVPQWGLGECIAMCDGVMSAGYSMVFKEGMKPPPTCTEASEIILSCIRESGVVGARPSEIQRYLAERDCHIDLTTLCSWLARRLKQGVLRRRRDGRNSYFSIVKKQNAFLMKRV